MNQADGLNSYLRMYGQGRHDAREGAPDASI
jgi:hypothetical protein